MNTINATKEDIRKAVGSQIFSVKFIKKDGSERTMNCRMGVQKHLRGGKSTINHKPNLLSVWDNHARAYRCVNINTIKEINIKGKKYAPSVSLMEV